MPPVPFKYAGDAVTHPGSDALFRHVPHSFSDRGGSILTSLWQQRHVSGPWDCRRSMTRACGEPRDVTPGMNRDAPPLAGSCHGLQSRVLAGITADYARWPCPIALPYTEIPRRGGGEWFRNPFRRRLSRPSNLLLWAEWRPGPGWCRRDLRRVPRSGATEEIALIRRRPPAHVPVVAVVERLDLAALSPRPSGPEQRRWSAGTIRRTAFITVSRDRPRRVAHGDSVRPGEEPGGTGAGIAGGRRLGHRRRGRPGCGISPKARPSRVWPSRRATRSVRCSDPSGDLYARIGARNRTEAIVWASRQGLLDEG